MNGITMSEQKTATLERCYYRSIGKMLQTDALFIEYSVEDQRYSVSVPNQGWALGTPALQFIGYIEITPNDFDESGFFYPDEEIKLPVKENNGAYQIVSSVFQNGVAKLKQSDWFNPRGTVWNSGQSLAVGGMSVDPGTGNQGAVDMDSKEKSES